MKKERFRCHTRLPQHPNFPIREKRHPSTLVEWKSDRSTCMQQNESRKRVHLRASVKRSFIHQESSEEHRPKREKCEVEKW